MLEYIKNYLESKNIRKRDIPSALLFMKATGYAIWFGMLVGCYKFQPLKRFFKMPMPKRCLDNFKKRHHVRYTKWQNFIQTKSEALANWKYFKPIPETFGANSKKMVTALTETIILYKLCLPITLPLTTILAIQVFKRETYL